LFYNIIFPTIDGERVKKFFLYAFFLSLYFCTTTLGQDSLTDLLTKQFHQAWNSGNINTMVSLLQPNAVYKSPQQIRYGRDKIESSVLKTNPKIYKVQSTKELHSQVDDCLAWAIGEYVFDIYEEYGYKTSKQLKGTYTYVFTKKFEQDWKLQMMIFDESQ
jgi:hypothetical protein